MGDTRPSRDSSKPETIGSYEIVRKLAVGGMGLVYLARQVGPVDFSREVVLKKLHEKYASDPHFVTMFVNEARIAASLTHPNIIHIYELVQDGDGYAIAMEYVRGGTVLSMLRARERASLPGLPYGPATRIVSTVCEALYYAYNDLDGHGVPRHVIHRDVSPSNVLVGYDGHVKLVDFGIAKVLDGSGGTQATTIKGKYGYLSPEQIKCIALDQRSDIFSLGTVLWEMTTGKRLFQRESEMQMMYAILEEEIPRPSRHVPDYPPALEAIVMKALARSRDDRYEDARQLASDLHEVAREERWAVDSGALANLVKETLPENQIAFGRIDSDSFSGAPARRRSKTTTGSWDDRDSFVSMVVVDERGPVEQPARARWLRPRDWVLIVVLLAASAAFWLWVVPMI